MFAEGSTEVAKNKRGYSLISVTPYPVCLFIFSIFSYIFTFFQTQRQGASPTLLYLSTSQLYNNYTAKNEELLAETTK
jgi:hypothetical protein